MRIGISQARLYTYVLYSVPGRRLHTEPQSTGEFASNFAPLAPSVRAILFLDTVLYRRRSGHSASDTEHGTVFLSDVPSTTLQTKVS
jgi:hypothetical protein